jgi:acetylornithine/succinyldiaminopimelate/putrescine aminotransferase
VDTVDAELLDNVTARGEELAEGLRSIAGVEEVRGRGLLLGAVTADPAANLVAAARDHGLLVLTAGDHVLRLAPPLTVTSDEVAAALSALDRIFR